MKTRWIYDLRAKLIQIDTELDKVAKFANIPIEVKVKDGAKVLMRRLKQAQDLLAPILGLATWGERNKLEEYAVYLHKHPCAGTWSEVVYNREGCTCGLDTIRKKVQGPHGD